jgi:imidazolonepropionase
MDGGGAGPLSGRAQGALGVIEGGAVAVAEGRIIAARRESEVRALCACDSRTTMVDAGGGVVAPGFVDPHTHLLFARSREKEFTERLRGVPYMEIAARGGGIHASVRAFREATDAALLANGRRRLAAFLIHGTTTVEAKSGYGLSVEQEVRALKLLRKLRAEQPVDIVPTFLGAHEVPIEFRGRKGAYVRQVIEEQIPAVAAEKLARYCDVFCERGVFDIEESRAICRAAMAAGMRIRLHADEFSPSGAADLAAELGADSADHLLAATEAGLSKMSRMKVIAVLLPGTSYSLGLPRHAPARRMVEMGIPIALGTDCNPGSCMTESMPAVISLAVTQLRMTAEESWVAATRNAACSLGLGKDRGRLAAGYRADIAVFDMPTYEYLPYHFGVNHVSAVIVSGRLVAERPHSTNGKAPKRAADGRSSRRGSGPARRAAASSR